MRYAKIRSMDIDNAPGLCCTLFVQGCTHHCNECFNPDTWDFSGGHDFTEEIENEFLNLCKDSMIKNVCILGGEPMDQNNMYQLLARIKKETNKPIWVWTGYSYDCLDKKILEYIDVLIDGKFMKELADMKLKFRGSSNQRVIDVQKSLKENKIVLFTD